MNKKELIKSSLDKLTEAKRLLRAAQDNIFAAASATNNNGQAEDTLGSVAVGINNTIAEIELTIVSLK